MRIIPLVLLMSMSSVPVHAQDAPSELPPVVVVGDPNRIPSSGVEADAAARHARPWAGSRTFWGLTIERRGSSRRIQVAPSWSVGLEFTHVEAPLGSYRSSRQTNFLVSRDLADDLEFRVFAQSNPTRPSPSAMAGLLWRF